MEKIKISSLEIVVVSDGETFEKAIQNAVEGAQLVEKLGFHRVWCAEHHNMPQIASSATSVIIGHLAGKTSTIRVGSGGIMLPNHTPLMVAEQFGTLETMYPNRIDLGLGRAPGTDTVTSKALRKNTLRIPFYFKGDVMEVQGYFNNTDANAKVRAFPGDGLKVPMYILGSSTSSAHLAAELGLPYVFAAHFAPSLGAEGSEIYHNNFIPSEQLKEPYFIACVNVIAADTLDEAKFLASSLYNMYAGILSQAIQPLSAPTDEMVYEGNAELTAAVQKMAACTFIGTEETLGDEIREFASKYQAKEVMITNYIYDIKKRLRAYEIIAKSVLG